LHDYDPRFETALRNQHDSGRLDVLFAAKHPHVTARLPLGAVAWRLRSESAAVEGLVADGRGGIARRARRLRLPMHVFGAVNARRAWMSRAYALLHDAYTLGVVDACGGLDRARGLLDPRRLEADRTKLRLALDGGEPIRVPARAGQIQVDVELGARLLGGVDAIAPGAQWNWDWILDRLTYGTAEQARAELGVRGIETLHPPAVAGTERRIGEVALGRHA
jgi:hypothetical protein